MLGRSLLAMILGLSSLSSVAHAETYTQVGAKISLNNKQLDGRWTRFEEWVAFDFDFQSVHSRDQATARRTFTGFDVTHVELGYGGDSDTTHRIRLLFDHSEAEWLILRLPQNTVLWRSGVMAAASEPAHALSILDGMLAGLGVSKTHRADIHLHIHPKAHRLGTVSAAAPSRFEAVASPRLKNGHYAWVFLSAGDLDCDVLWVVRPEWNARGSFANDRCFGSATDLNRHWSEQYVADTRSHPADRRVFDAILDTLQDRRHQELKKSFEAQLNFDPTDSTSWSILAPEVLRSNQNYRKDQLIRILGETQWPESFWTTLTDLLGDSRIQTRLYVNALIMNQKQWPTSFWKHINEQMRSTRFIDVSRAFTLLASRENFSNETWSAYQAAWEQMKPDFSATGLQSFFRALEKQTNYPEWLVGKIEHIVTHFGNYTDIQPALIAYHQARHLPTWSDALWSGLDLTMNRAYANSFLEPLAPFQILGALGPSRVQDPRFILLLENALKKAPLKSLPSYIPLLVSVPNWTSGIWDGLFQAIEDGRILTAIYRLVPVLSLQSDIPSAFQNSLIPLFDSSSPVVAHSSVTVAAQIRNWTPEVSKWFHGRMNHYGHVAYPMILSGLAKQRPISSDLIRIAVQELNSGKNLRRWVPLLKEQWNPTLWAFALRTFELPAETPIRNLFVETLSNQSDLPEGFWNVLPHLLTDATSVQAVTEMLDHNTMTPIPSSASESLLNAEAKNPQKFQKNRAWTRVKGRILSAGTATSHVSSVSTGALRHLLCEVIHPNRDDWVLTDAPKDNMILVIPFQMMSALYQVRTERVCGLPSLSAKGLIDTFYRDQKSHGLRTHMASLLPETRAILTTSYSSQVTDMEVHHGRVYLVELLHELSRSSLLTHAEMKLLQTDLRVTQSHLLHSILDFLRDGVGRHGAMGSNIQTYTLTTMLRAAFLVSPDRRLERERAEVLQLLDSALGSALRSHYPGSLFLAYEKIQPIPIDLNDPIAIQEPAARTLSFMSIYQEILSARGQDTTQIARHLPALLNRVSENRFLLANLALTATEPHTKSEGYAGAHYFFPNLFTSVPSVKKWTANSSNLEAQRQGLISSLAEIFETDHSSFPEHPFQVMVLPPGKEKFKPVWRSETRYWNTLLGSLLIGAELSE